MASLAFAIPRISARASVPTAPIDRTATHQLPLEIITTGSKPKWIFVPIDLYESEEIR